MCADLHVTCPQLYSVTAATLSTPVMSAGLCVLRDVIATANSVMSAGLVYSVMSLAVYSVVWPLWLCVFVTDYWGATRTRSYWATVSASTATTSSRRSVESRAGYTRVYEETRWWQPPHA